MRKKTTIGVIGFGNMGSSLGSAMAEESFDVLVYDKQAKKTKNQKGIKTCIDAVTLIENSSIVILAIKPQDIPSFLKRNKEGLLSSNPLLISVAAGLETSYFEKMLPKIKIIRAMPNLGAKERLSMSFISKGKFSTDSDLKLAEKIFKSIGEVMIANEEFIDKATALSGSGPGYIYYLMESFYESALNLGFNKAQAKKITTQTFLGSIEVIKDSKVDFSVWVKKVASPGGTTQAGLDVLKNKGCKEIIQSTVKAAFMRAKTISKER